MSKIRLSKSCVVTMNIYMKYEHVTTENRKGDYKRLMSRSSIAKSLRLYVNKILVTCAQKNTYRK